MLKRRILTNSFHLIVLLSLGAGATTQHPIAIDRFPQGPAFVLTQEGVLFKLSLGPESGVVVGSVALPSSGYLVDMAACDADEGHVLYVASSNASVGSSSIGARGIIRKFSTDGKLLGTSYAAGTIGGLGCDRENKTLYYDVSTTSEIYSLQSNGKPKFVRNVPGNSSGARLGALAVARGYCYVVNLSDGTVTELSLLGGAPRAVGSFGLPRALMVTSDGADLLIGDAGRKQISRAADLRTKKINLSVIYGSSPFVTGVLQLDGQRFAASDNRAGELVVFSAKGVRLYTVVLTWQ